MNLLIVESPTKAKKISAMLGSNWRVQASLGHIRDLPKKEMGVSEGTFELTYTYTDRGRDVCKKLADEVKRADRVFLGTDPDREGEAIAWHLADVLGLRDPLRVRFNEITKSVIEKTIASPDRIDMERVHAQEARRALDRLVGYRVSPKLSDMIGQSLSAGRVQTPALRLVVEREREIKAFVVRDHFGVELTFNDGWIAAWNFKPFLPGEDEIWTDAAAAEIVAQVRDLEVLSTENKEARSAPPAAFKTSTLQQGASVSLKIDPEDAMRLAQKLFEGGHITYHRTDDVNLSEDAVKAIREYAQVNGLPLPPAPRRWKVAADAQEAHEGIRPTHFEVEVAGENDQERALYQLIRLRAIASQLADAEYDVRVMRLRSTTPVLQSQPVEFIARGRTLTKSGWRGLTDSDATEESDASAEPNNPVPDLDGGTKLTALSGAVKAKKTSPPGAFTKATLIKELERRGIGRPATYAAIMSGLERRSYIDVDGKRKLHPTKLGDVVIDALVGRFSFCDYNFTKIMEASLDKIAAGATSYVGVVGTTNKVLDEELVRLAAANVPRLARDGPKCPTCKEGVLVKRDGKFGKFHSCDAFRNNGCTARYRDNRGKPDLNSPIVARVIPDDAQTCPKCQKGKLLERKGPRGVFYGCSDFKISKGKKTGCDAVFDTLPAAQGDAA